SILNDSGFSLTFHPSKDLPSKSLIQPFFCACNSVGTESRQTTAKAAIRRGDILGVRVMWLVRLVPIKIRYTVRVIQIEKSSMSSWSHGGVATFRIWQDAK